MAIEVLKIESVGNYRETLRRAAEMLRAGRLVAFPTETVYGVGARGDRREAVAGLRAVKGRSESKPFTLHIGDPQEIHRYVPHMTAFTRRFVRKAWPGPVTLVFPVAEPLEAPAIRDAGAECVDLLYHDRTIGVRCPADNVAADLLIMAAVPIVAASANRADNPPPRSADGVVAELDGDVDLLLDGGTARYAKASTVVRLGADGFEVLRDGVIDERTLRRYAALNILFVCSGNTCRSPMAAAICSHELARRMGCSVGELVDRGVTVSSAGAGSFGGAPASDGATKVLARRSMDLSGHVASGLDVESINRADHIYCMTASHRDAVQALVPSAASRTQLLAGEAEIDDPFGGTDEQYERCATDIQTAVVRRVEEVLA